MNLNDDAFDFTLKPKKGRRANRSSQNSLELDNIDSPQIPNISKKSGWAEETLKSAKNRSSTNLIEQQRFQEQRIDLEDNIPTVPDIEEIHDEATDDISPHAPSCVGGVRSPLSCAYGELSGELVRGLNAALGDIDLGPLTRALLPPGGAPDNQPPWTMQHLEQQLLNTHFTADIHTVIHSINTA